MKSLRHIVPTVGLIAAAFLAVAAAAAAESESQRFSRLRGQLCTTHIDYLDAAAGSVADLERTLGALAHQLPDDESAADLERRIAQAAHEAHGLLEALDLQLTVAINACDNLASQIKQPTLMRPYEGQRFSKSTIIGGLREELCSLYVDNLAEILLRGDWILEDLGAIQSDPAAAGLRTARGIDLPGAENRLRQLVDTAAGQFFASQRACLAISESAAKRDFWRAAEAGLRPGLTVNPYLVLLQIYD
ncbi:MAG: hypothetical protein PVI39_05405 [Desulfobacteraceae bacterium]|jgi:hypothetical protein